MKRILTLVLTFTFLLCMTACGQTPQEISSSSEGTEPLASAESKTSETLPSEATEESTAPTSEGETDSTAENPGGFNLDTATVRNTEQVLIVAVNKSDLLTVRVILIPHLRFPPLSNSMLNLIFPSSNTSI